MTRNIASVRLISRKARTVELLGPRPLGSRRPTDIELRFQTYGPQPARSVGFCYSGGERRARFHVDQGSLGDSFLDYLENARTAVRLAKPYGIRGYVVEEAGVEEGGSTVGQRSHTDPPRTGEIYHSGHAGQVLRVGGKPVRK